MMNHPGSCRKYKRLFFRMSMRSRSPEDSSSLLSGSLDSVLNHSREEEEIRALMNDHNDDGVRENDLSEHILHGMIL